MKTLVLTNDFGMFFPKITGEIALYDIYRCKLQTKWKRLLRKIHLMSPMPMKYIWFSEWANVINQYDKVIVFNTGNADLIANYLKKKYPEKEIVFWYWAPVELTVKPEGIDREKISVWSFDESDCDTYNLKHNTQFYFYENLNRVDLEYKSPLCDVVFVGSEKDRLQVIVNLEKQINDLGFSTYFHVTKSNSHYKSDECYKYSNPISYPQLLACISKSKVILDIVSSDQTGMTLRPLEALFFKKKLITNDKKIRDRRIYNSKNIFIIGLDDEKDLINFINSPYDEEGYQSLTNYYSFVSWVNRF